MIDIGNTKTKYAYFAEGRIKRKRNSQNGRHIKNSI